MADYKSESYIPLSEIPLRVKKRAPSQEHREDVGKVTTLDSMHTVCYTHELKRSH